MRTAWQGLLQWDPPEDSLAGPGAVVELVQFQRRERAARKSTNVVMAPNPFSSLFYLSPLFPSPSLSHPPPSPFLPSPLFPLSSPSPTPLPPLFPSSPSPPPSFCLLHLYPLPSSPIPFLTSPPLPNSLLPLSPSAPSPLSPSSPLPHRHAPGDSNAPSPPQQAIHAFNCCQKFPLDCGAMASAGRFWGHPQGRIPLLSPHIYHCHCHLPQMP